MIEFFWKDAAQDANRQLVQAAGTRYQSMMVWRARYLVLLTTGIGAFSVLLAAHWWAANLPTISFWPWFFGFGIAFAMVAFYGTKGHQFEFLWWLCTLYLRIRISYLRKRQTDYLGIHYLVLGTLTLVVWASWLYLIISHMIAPHRELLVPSEVDAQNPLRTLTGSLITIAVGIVAAQVALFNFMFSQLLGRYTSGIVETIVRHRAITAARYGAFGILILLLTAFAFGVPSSLIAPVPWFQVFAITVCLLSFIGSTWVANAGVRADQAILFAGHYFARQVKLAIPRPIDPKSRAQKVWWALSFLGLDWRDPRRFVSIGQPKAGQSFAIDVLRMFYGIASKAIQENQHDILNIALAAIHRVASAYADRRALYMDADDQVFGYLNDQTAALVQTASKSPNQYMITDVVRLIGILGAESVRVGQLPTGEGDAGAVNASLRSHSVSGLWLGLLKEAVIATITLERTHATFEAITQMEQIASALQKAGYSAPVRHTYLNTLETIHALCALKPDAYRLTLAARCVQGLLNVWFTEIRNTSRVLVRENLTTEACEVLQRMADRAFSIERNPLIAGLNDLPNVLVSRLAPDRPLLQDLICAALLRPVSKALDVRVAVDEGIEIVRLLSALAEKALASKNYNASYFLDAIYDVATLVLVDWPSALDVAEAKVPARGRTREMTERERMERAIFQALQQLLKSFYQAKDVYGPDWKHAAFSLLGVALSVNKDAGRPSLDQLVRSTVQLYESLVVQEVSKPGERVHEEDFEYLQLAGAWTVQFLNDTTTADRIAKFVGEFKPFSSAIGGGHDRFDHYGYPSLHFSDFAIKRPANPYISKAGWSKLQRIAKETMTEAVLMPYYRQVEQTREPLRKKFWERVRAAEKEKFQRSDETKPDGE